MKLAVRALGSLMIGSAVAMPAVAQDRSLNLFARGGGYNVTANLDVRRGNAVRRAGCRGRHVS